ncbi:MAG TPA: hypothetical protein VIC07_06955 [Acidimicrobiia bacterium]
MRAPTIVGGFVLGILGFLALVFLYGTDLVDATSDYPRAADEYRRLQCLGDIILEQVPVDASLAVLEPDLPRPDYWKVRLREVVSPEREVVFVETDADYLVEAIEGTACDGVDLLVSAP